MVSAKVRIPGKGGEQMSKAAVDQILRKASADARFRSQLKKDFDVAVKPYSLTAAEKKQLRSGAGVATTASVPEREAARAQGRVLERNQGRVLERNQGRVLERNQGRVLERNQGRVLERNQGRVLERNQGRVLERNET
jgi:ribosomal protein S28E/S33